MFTCHTKSQTNSSERGAIVSWGFPGYFALPLSGIPVPPRSVSRRLGARPNTPMDERPLGRLRLTCQLGRQGGRVVSASDLQSGGPGFESRSGHLLDLFSVVPSSNPRPTGCLLPVNLVPRVLSYPVMLYLNYLFSKYLLIVKRFRCTFSTLSICVIFFIVNKIVDAHSCTGW